MPRSLLEVAPTKPKMQGLFFFLGAAVVLLILLIILFILSKFIKPRELMKSQLRKRRGETSKDFFTGNLRTIIYFDFQTLKKATKNFHPGNLLGSGGFGPVYQGKLADGRLVAVKKLSLDKSQQGESEFLSEVKMITSIQHKNLVRLIGCCSDGSQRLLVYEYMKNRSLDFIIYGKIEQFLNWNTRFQIIYGIARGLQYLHEDSHVRIVHRDIKASNILLDEKFQPRIGDFGLARFFPEDQAYLSTTFAGTFHVTFLMQLNDLLLCGLWKSVPFYFNSMFEYEFVFISQDLTLPSEMQYLPEYAWKLHERSQVIDLVDPKMREEGFVQEKVMQAINVAFLCLQPHANRRPRMSEVVAMLTCKVEMVETPTRPAFLDRRRKRDENTLSWDTISEPFPSPLCSESPCLPQQPN
ncbi:hypothetical protein JRO89_XS04G0267700 [Xanthoceras sorbifolium]|uniref:Protein kinase domain-containing protein n=1 Tax=Xanthoceras sorbifolium TaxID=99658 RepID=A0ABQ8I7J5_9ROSI|nr:hypothetical protein JRO89_XS04G0267700 [Xanthoceras sorbifolium]